MASQRARVRKGVAAAAAAAVVLVAVALHATPRDDAYESQLAGYAAPMNEVARKSLGRMLDGETVDLAREMTRITMGVVAAARGGVPAVVRRPS
jgi:hypothetical protein